MFVLTPEQQSQLIAVAERWEVQTFELFGSGLGEAFGPKSDIDILVAFHSGSRRTLFDLIEIEEEMATILARPVDLVTRRSIERSPNPIRRQSILESARPLYGVAA